MPAEPERAPAPPPEAPCGAALKLPCCNQAAAVSHASAWIAPAGPGLLVAWSEALPADLLAARSFAPPGAARAAPDLLATTVLRF
jgi:hypothetical protein